MKLTRAWQLLAECGDQLGDVPTYRYDLADGGRIELPGGSAHPQKAGSCVNFNGLETFVRLRAKLDGCLTGCRLAKDRAADALTKVMTREALDYPA